MNVLSIWQYHSVVCLPVFSVLAVNNPYWIQWSIGIVVLLVTVVAITFLWNIQLRRTVATRTQQLVEKHAAQLAETAEKTLAQKKLTTLFSIADKLIATRTFNEIGDAIFSELSAYDPEGKRGGKLSVYYEDQDLFKIEYLEHPLEEIPPTNVSCKLCEIKYFSKITIDEKRTYLVPDTHSEYALSIDPTLASIERSTLIFIPLYYQTS
ncbi:MAG TPA: hypothetical protein VK470_06685, partial [Bacteroidota bacterium]|nr:hypothetical protein [Bacteroidota bacterium]